MTRVLESEQRSEKWMMARASVVTAADIPAFLGRSFYKPAHVAIHEKITRALKLLCTHKEDLVVAHQAASQAAAPAIMWGVENEPLAAEHFERVTGHRLAFTGLLQHPTDHWLAGSPDAITHCGVLVEFKCPFTRRISMTATRPPHYYVDQLEALLCITGLDKALYAEFKPPDTMAIIPFTASPDWLGRNRDELLCVYYRLQLAIRGMDRPTPYYHPGFHDSSAPVGERTSSSSSPTIEATCGGDTLSGGGAPPVPTTSS